MQRSLLLFFSFILIYSCNLIFALELENPIENISKKEENFFESKYYKEIGVTEWILKNGMKVVLKPSNFEEDEIVFHLSAKGGFSELKSSQRGSGELAASIAWESGVGDLTSDQIFALLYEHSIEFTPKITAFGRSIEGSSNEEGLETLLQLTHLYFTQPKFNQEAFHTVINYTKENIRNIAQDIDSTFKNAFIRVNAKSLDALRPLNLKDIQKADFGISKQFFEQSFTNPADFVCVIVGNFNIDKINLLVKKYLASIPQSKKAMNPTKAIPAFFPKGIIEKKEVHNRLSENLTRITIPLQINLNEEVFHRLELFCHIVEGRLRRVAGKEKNTMHGIHVAYELPLYPYNEFPWLTIQFSGHANMMDKNAKAIIAELARLQKDGLADNEIMDVKIQQARNDNFWHKDNDFWALILSNYYLWNWNPSFILKNWSDPKLTSKVYYKDLITSFSLENYTAIHLLPK